MTPEHAHEHPALWTDVVRRVPDAGIADPATLLAWCAWQKGNGALANLAIDRALEATPGYSMASLVREALSAGLLPAAAVPPRTPAEVADSYRAQAQHKPDIEHPELEADGERNEPRFEPAGCQMIFSEQWLQRLCRSASLQVSAAEDARFELARGCPQHAFQACALGH